MLADLLKESKHTIVYTGAGMSTESGLPDFRSAKTGMWEMEDPAKVASVDALNQQFEQFFQFYKQRVLAAKEAGPHEGHRILSKWEEQGLISGIITQNVDGFHTMTGSENVMELHGTLREVHCESCGKVYGNERYEQDEFYCECGGKLRPSVVLFGEMLPEEAFLQSVFESEKADLFIVLGSSLTVSPANQFPMLAKENGAKLVIINMEPTSMDYLADLVINERKIGEVLREADRELS
ncbi:MULTISPECIES: NAD-dependent deacylase [unclassified Sporosarcina]|uniref:NAD-dependent deacylase n=1 Tax=unclassified Sporosarcina TaxID=2647733 RepID=UPI00203BDCEC|nr:MULTISPECIES: NAD-dependent deacylase [unclassified Sporosarcina]GKV64747.1 NAD-dependent deacetylase [Sporosarcina sp. NCCP-2331]GLB54857.1 NAD-dependent deacetylase [Sporosarcina sp. NCCP-2378]